MENLTFEQLQDFAKKTADLAIKKLGVDEDGSDYIFNTVLNTLDYICNYPPKKSK